MTIAFSFELEAITKETSAIGVLGSKIEVLRISFGTDERRHFNANDQRVRDRVRVMSRLSVTECNQLTYDETYEAREWNDKFAIIAMLGIFSLTQSAINNNEFFR